MVNLSTTFAHLMFFLVQDRGPIVEMADQLRSNGKIYVVVAILLVIFIGIILYLISLDKKISKLENNLNNKK